MEDSLEIQFRIQKKIYQLEVFYVQMETNSDFLFQMEISGSVGEININNLVKY